MTSPDDSPVSIDVDAVPTGVAAPDGSELYLQVPGGIDAVDPETGATRWSTRAAAIPVIALDDTLIALATTTAGDLIWGGVARLVTIERAAPHTSRGGAVFILPQDKVRFLDARVTAGVLDALWAPLVAGHRPALVTPAEGTLRAELASRSAKIGDEAGLPPVVRRALLGATLRAPAGRGHASWPAGDGWSAIAMVRGLPVLHHWTADGEATTTTLLEAAEVDGFALEHVDRRCAVLRVCSTAHEGRDELRVVDAVYGAVRPSVAAADIDGRLAPPFGVYGDDLLAVRLTPAGRVLVRIDTDSGAERWRRPLPATPKR